jgi:hypothetical protein
VSTIAGSQSLIVVRHRNHTGHADRALQRGAARGDLTRLRSGAYVPTAVWKLLSPADRRRLEAAAMAEVHAGFIACHRSAAALWHVPTIQKPDGLVHSRVTQAAGTRTEHGVRKHAVRDADLHLTTVDGIACTTLDRTVLDIAATEPFSEAVVALDWALRHHTTEARLREVLEEWDPVRGRRRAEAALAFADPRSGSAGESWSRVQIDEGGLPAPELQQEFSDGGGLVGYVDFWWPEFNLIGEFDGLKKYREADLLAGRTPGEVVTDEKIREDRLRATPTRPGVDRWIWATLTERGSLVQRLVVAGLPRRR